MFCKAGAVLTIAFWLPRGAGATRQRAEGAAGSALAPNAFVRIGTDDTVTVISKHLEMGQGAYTGLATLVAEELDADWKNRFASKARPADAKLYNNLAFGPMQGTGGSIVDREFVRSVAQGRRDGARNARDRSSTALEGAGERDHRFRPASSSTSHRASRRASASWSRMPRSCRCRPT